MGRKRRRHNEGKQAAAEQTAAGAETHAKVQPYNSTPADLPCRLLALQPGGGGATAIAFGKKLAVVTSGSEAPVDLGATAEHGSTVRALAFDPTGAWLLSGDDTKTMRLWRTSDWTVAHTFTTAKKPSCGVFSRDGGYAFAGDKFGDVAVASTADGASAPLLGHYCSTISSLALSPDGRCLASTDRDNKVRVSLLPAEPLKGAHEIQSFCLGHDAFVSCAVFVQGDGGATALVTASGDGSVRLWNHLKGEQLAQVQLTQAPETDAAAEAADGAADSTAGPEADAPAQAGAAAYATPAAAQAEQPGAAAADGDGEEAAEQDADEADAGGELVPSRPRPAAIITLAVSPNNRFVAVAIEGRDAIELLAVSTRIGRNCGHMKGTLSQLEPVTLAQVQLPTSLAFDAAGRLWAAGGPLRGEGSDQLCLGVARPETDASDCERFVDAREAHVLAALRGAVTACTLSPAEVGHIEQQASANGQLAAHLKKKTYRPEEIEERKRKRNGVRLMAAGAAEQAQ